MATTLVTRTEVIASTVGATTEGDPFKVAGNLCEIHILVAPVNFTIRVSTDGVNWITGTDADAVALAALGAGVYRIMRETPLWIQGQVAADAAGPQDCVWNLSVSKAN